VDYVLGGKIGSGGFGFVREVRGTRGFVGALKTLADGYSEEDLRRFRREVRLQSQLVHRNIVPVEHMDLDATPPWYVMPLARCSLRDRLDVAHGPSELGFFRDAAYGLDYAHRNGVVHRDLKPQNILIFVDQEGTYAAISDFGLGAHLEADSTPLTRTNASLGTPWYRAPELSVDAKSAGVPADVYSMGKVLYEILTGLPPFPEMDLTLVPNGFAYIVRRATMRDPDRRYPTIASMLQNVELAVRPRGGLEKTRERRSEERRVGKECRSRWSPYH